MSYSGDKYYFESPEFLQGINIIEGDNGSGKSTISYFIEFGLGGKIKYFTRNDKKQDEEYKQIVNDKNNYIELIISIDNIEYKLKRFINKNDIFVTFSNGKVQKFCVNRKDCKEEVFSDWLLDKLNIKRFELNLGEASWYFNFSDVFRLLNYDQDTEPRKIFKTPNNENFVSDSTVIRTSIFETLMGTSSDEYFLKMNELNECKLKRKEAQYILDEFNKMNPNLKSTLEAVRIEEEMLMEQMNKLLDSRTSYQKEHINVGEKFKNIEAKKSELIRLQILDSENKVNKKNLEIEKNKIEHLLRVQENEIDSIIKTISTHEKLNLFDFTLCPFCANEIKKEDKKCICGSNIDENNYEKFLYNSDEYQEILKHKNKSLETIKSAIKSYGEDLTQLNTDINQNLINIEELNIYLKTAIDSFEYSGNSQMIDDIDNKIGKVKENIFKYKELSHRYTQKDKYEKEFKKKDDLYKSLLKSFNSMKIDYHTNNKIIIEHFNKIYNQLMTLSSCKSTSAMIDEEYNPYIDDGDYREKSASVPKRMMYYFTLLSMALKYKNIKHPKFLLMDTPEEAGIDEDHLTENIKLFSKALELSKNNPNDKINSFQFILTTGINKYPKEYEEFVKLRFNKKKGDFILKEK